MRFYRHGPLTPSQKALAAAHAGWVAGVARRLVAHFPGLGDDLTSECFWHLVLAARTFDPAFGVPFRAYFAPRFKTAVNNCRHRARRYGPWPDGLDAPAPWAPDPGDFEDRLRLLTDPADRALLRAVYRDGWRLKPLARSVGIGESTLMGRHARALSVLRAVGG